MLSDNIMYGIICRFKTLVLSASYSADFGTLFRSSRRSLNNSDNASSLLKL